MVMMMMMMMMIPEEGKLQEAICIQGATNDAIFADREPGRFCRHYRNGVQKITFYQNAVVRCAHPHFCLHWMNTHIHVRHSDMRYEYIVNGWDVWYEGIVNRCDMGYNEHTPSASGRWKVTVCCHLCTYTRHWTYTNGVTWAITNTHLAQVDGERWQSVVTYICIPDTGHTPMAVR